MKGLVFTTTEKMYTKDFDAPLFETLGEVVGAWIEIVHPEGLRSPLCLVCNDDGLRHNLPMNVFGSVLYGTYRHGHPIVGNIVIMREGMTPEGPDLVGLTDEDIQTVKRLADEISGGVIRWIEPEVDGHA